MAIINWIDALEDAKRQKQAELSIACNKAILGVFPCIINNVVYYFSNDAEAQVNFEKADNAFYRGRMTEITWTAYDRNANVVRLDLDAPTFEIVYMSHLNHIQTNISKYRDDLMLLLTNATTIPQVKSITWDMFED